MELYQSELGKILVEYLSDLQEFHLDRLQNGDPTKVIEMAKTQAVLAIVIELKELPDTLMKLKLKKNPATGESTLVDDIEEKKPESIRREYGS